MKFAEKIEEFQRREENKGKIIIARCGVFMVAIGKDAILLSKILHLKLTCFKKGVCKTGIPVSYMLRYMDLIERAGYGYVVYDYDKETRSLIDKYRFEGKENLETSKNIGCKGCEKYKEKCLYNTINIFELMEKRKRGEKDDEQ